MSANCCDERNFIDKHDVNAESNIFIILQDTFRHDQIIDHRWFWLSPGGFSFQSMDVLSINFVSSSNITCGHRTVQDEILGDDIFEVSRRQVSDLRIKVASLFSVLYLALAVPFFIFLHCLNQCDLAISSVVVMQTILVHYKMQLLTWLVYGKHAIR